MSRFKLTRGDLASAKDFLARAKQNAQQNNFAVRFPDVAAMQSQIYLYQGKIAAAAQSAQEFELPLMQTRVLLAQANPSAALPVLETHHRLVQEKKWPDQLLRVLILEALAQHMQGNKDSARKLLGEALTMGEPEAFVRPFIEEGTLMRSLMLDYRGWIENQSGGRASHHAEYVEKLLAAFTPSSPTLITATNNAQSELVEPLSQRELEVLKLICQGLSNQEICQRLFLALDTVKGHNRRIFEKLAVHRRAEAIARARELNLF